jgi:phage protein D
VVEENMAQNADADLNVTPRYTIEVGGQELTQAAPMGLEAVSVEDHVDMIGVAELTISGQGDGTSSNTSWNQIEIGGDVSIKLGGSSEELFKGTITSMRHGFQQGRDTLTIMCMDPMHKLAASRETKTYEEMTDSDIANQVISDAGCEVGTVDATTETRKYVLQRNESHYQFLRRLAARNGYLLMANKGKIDFIKPQYSGSGPEIDKSKLVMLDYTFSPRALPSEVKVIGWDYVKKEMVEGTATAGDIDTIGGGPNAVDGKIWSGQAAVSDVWVNSQDGAKELAKAELNRLARSFMRGRAIVQGNAELRANTLCSFPGHQSNFRAAVYILSSRHRVFVGSGFTTEIVFCSNTYPQGG